MIATLTPELRFEVADLYADYAECLDEQRFADWPDFFTEDCVYKIIPRENFERGLPLCTVWAESRGMLKDRVTGITETMMYMPRTCRHIVSAPRIHALGADGSIGVRANYLVVQILADEPARVFQVGRYLDTLVRSDGVLRFREKLCVFDDVLIDNSLIYPV
ncbi:aromatic-ring-hydroxylating dioxygenase subunit beta [Arenibaculum sp.]|jgi:salicylate 5-hydroxylase small subunit|uniref:aromatic-ring-hydroxylating dioxygenase subunit beta n=1 Tax=Arenibaculum sp. TaxID=2865862 RepID=UPI002E0FABBD|nr:aromatic-ring-hydroxylating dioxygenase subunit beta [Arenibaculum sp.]